MSDRLSSQSTSPLALYRSALARSPVAWRRENLVITLTLADRLHPLRSGFPRPCTITDVFSVDLAVAACVANLKIPIAHRVR
jgi:hypothetical protein